MVFLQLKITSGNQSVHQPFNMLTNYSTNQVSLPKCFTSVCSPPETCSTVPKPCTLPIPKLPQIEIKLEWLSVCKPCIYRVCSSCVYCLCPSYQYTVSKRVINYALSSINIHDAMVSSFLSFWASPVIVISPIIWRTTRGFKKKCAFDADLQR